MLKHDTVGSAAVQGRGWGTVVTVTAAAIITTTVAAITVHTELLTDVPGSVPGPAEVSSH